MKLDVDQELDAIFFLIHIFFFVNAPFAINTDILELELI